MVNELNVTNRRKFRARLTEHGATERFHMPNFSCAICNFTDHKS